MNGKPRRARRGHHAFTKPRLREVQRLANHGVRVVYALGWRGDASRCEPPGGYLTVPEAARLIGTYDEKVRRLIRKGKIPTRRRHGQRMVRITDLKRAAA